MHPDDYSINDQSPAHGLFHAFLLVAPFWALGLALAYWAIVR